MKEVAPLRLIALDFEDLQVVSAHAQDAVVRMDDMAYLPKSQRFALIINRFNWQDAESKPRRGRKSYVRCRAALNFDRVVGVQAQNLRQNDSGVVLELLAVEFAESNAPAGQITLVFAGGSAIRLDVECIETQLEDLGAAWSTSRLPEHALDDSVTNEQKYTDG